MNKSTKLNKKAILRLSYLLVMACAMLFAGCSGIIPDPSEDKPGGDTPGNNITEDNDDALTHFPQAEKLGLTINDQYINLNLNSCTALLCDTTNGVYSFEYEKNLSIEPGTVFQLLSDDDCYIIVATEKAQKDDNKYTVKGERGDLCDIFSSGQLHLAAGNYQSTRTSSFAALYPTAVDYVGEDGKRQWTASTRGSLPALDILNMDYSVHNEYFIKQEGSIEDKDDVSSAVYSIVGKVDEFDAGMEVSVGIDMTFDKAEEDKMASALFKRIRAKDLDMDFYISASVHSKLKVSLEASGKAKFSRDAKKWKELMHDRSFMFMAGEIPVVVTVGADLLNQIDVSAEGSLCVNTGYKAEGDFRFGAHYNMKEKALTPIYDQNFDFEYTPITLTSNGNLYSKVHIFPQVNLKLYGTLSPYVQFKPYLKTNYACKSQTSIAASNRGDFYGQSLNIYAGVDCRVGLDVYLPGTQRKLIKLKTEDFNLAEPQLYQSPYKLKRLDENLVTYGNNNEMEFLVLDKDFVQDKEIPSRLSPFITLESLKGKKTPLSIIECDEFGEDVRWEPAGEDDKLYVRVYDGAGNVACEQIVKPLKPTICSNDKHPHFIDLGLPSGTLWCCCNVGATTPLQVGNLFAWCMTDVKTRFGDQYYPFYKYDGNRYFEGGSFYYPERAQYTVPVQNLQGTKYDAAKAHMGSNYVTPDFEQVKELIDSTRAQDIIYKGVRCTVVVGPNDNAILLPHCGFGDCDGRLSVKYGVYLTSEANVPAGTYTYEALGGKRPRIYTFSTSSRNHLKMSDLEFPSNGFGVRPVHK